MKKELYDFQRQALDKIQDRDNAALFWQMGAGKTVSSIELTEREAWNTPTLICLVLKSTVSQWIDELKEQTDRQVFNGYKKSKKDGIKPFIDATGRKALVIGYDAYKAKSAAELRQYINDNAEQVTMICDESSLIGHMTSERTKAVMKTKTKHRLLLSGTPATGGKMEAMIPTMNMLGWNITKEKFLQQFCHVYEWTDPTRPWMTIPIIQGYKNIDKLREGLKEHGGSFITMEEAGVQLPATTEQIISIQTPPEYKKFMKHGIVKIGDQEIIGENNLTKMLYSRQICSVYNPAKAAALEELLEQAGDEMVIVFYNWTAELRILQSVCGKLHRPMSLINGQTKDTKNYQAGTPGTVILCQYQAASMGLNLQKARICIFYSQCLSYSDYEQAKARIHRIGQSRNCNFYNLICSDSIEEDILETLEQRKDYTEQLFTEKHGGKREVKAA